ncbi:MAG: PspC domain-containing protein [Acidimicrobiales bacterium]
MNPQNRPFTKGLPLLFRGEHHDRLRIIDKQPLIASGHRLDTPGRPQRPLRRNSDGALLGGVCSGLARRFGVRVRTVRIITVLLALFFALGLAAYMTIWMLVPRRDESSSIFTRTMNDRRDKEILFAILIAVLTLFIAFITIGVGPPGVSLWFLALSCLEAVMVWRGASEDERENLRQVSSNLSKTRVGRTDGWRAVALRTGFGVIFVIWGISLMSRVSGEHGAAAYVLAGASALVLGLFALFAPWWIRSIQDLSMERRARVRAQDRADMAAHVHDSVMQTLSLIQRSANDPVEVTRLARQQERDLRSWLANPETFGAHSSTARTLSQAILDVESEIEDNYDISVDAVLVGDIPLDDATLALVAACREAALNAAKWSGARDVAIYVEVEAKQVSLFVRDRGSGFDPAAVAPDRQGIAGSIIERMRRHGGTATVSSSIGAGTEVELRLPRASSST